MQVPVLASASSSCMPWLCRSRNNSQLVGRLKRGLREALSSFTGEAKILQQPDLQAFDYLKPTLLVCSYAERHSNRL